MSDTLCLTGLTLVTPFDVIPDGALLVRDGRIVRAGRRVEVGVPPAAEPLHLPGSLALPGLTDLHIHGAGGVDFDPCDAAGFERASAMLASHGVTQALATLLPPPGGRWIERLAQVRTWLERCDRSPVLCGVHLEGPFLNPEMPGAIRREDLWPPDLARAEALFDALGPWLKLMTISPELPGALEIIRRGTARGVVMSAGHSTASYERMGEAIAAGVRQVTHLFNAMPPAHHRNPGILGAALTRPELLAQLIADGVHVHPVMLGLALRAKGRDGTALISDAVMPAGLPDGSYVFAGDRVEVTGGVARRPGGAICGSTALLDTGLRTLTRQCGIGIAEAAQATSWNGARALGLDGRKGRLAAGYDADVAIFSENLDPEMTLLGGRVAWRKG